MREKRLVGSSNPFEGKRFLLGMFYFGCVLATFFGIGAAVDYLSDYSHFNAPEAPGVIGQKGFIPAAEFSDS
jgi:hypothetical protein